MRTKMTSRFTTMRMLPPVADRHLYFEGHQVDVEFYEFPSQRQKFIANIPERLLQLFTPSVANCVEQDSLTNSMKLRIRVASLEQADEVEVLALKQVFQHMSNLMQSDSPCTDLPLWTTVKEGVRLYRAYQMLHLYTAAEDTRAALMHLMKTNPLDSLDVETLWHAFGPSGDWFNTMLHNLAYFYATNNLPDHDYIFWYLDNELLQLTDVQRSSILYQYEAHKGLAKRESRGMPKVKAFLKQPLGIRVAN